MCSAGLGARLSLFVWGRPSPYRVANACIGVEREVHLSWRSGGAIFIYISEEALRQISFRALRKCDILKLIVLSLFGEGVSCFVGERGSDGGISAI